ncbi:unnamed protein product [Penicillium discolor]
MTANASVNIHYWRWTVPPPSSRPGTAGTAPATALSPPQPSIPVPPRPDTAPAALSPPQPSIPGDENMPEVQDLDRDELLAKDFYRTSGIHVM